ncbi:UNVERIFIED_CONTAM: transcription initiation factor IIB, partial [Siphonaria sp. JEL0065]
MEPFCPNLNIHLMCSNCKDKVPNIIESFHDGDLICGDCGLVLGDRLIDTRAEWRTFADSEGDNPSRVGDVPNSILGDVNMLAYTSISFKTDLTGRAKELRQTHNSMKETRQDDVLLEGAKKMSSMCERIGLEKHVVDSSLQLYKLARSIKQLDKKPAEWVMTCCIHLACSKQRVNRTFKEICSVSNVPFKSLTKVYSFIKTHFQKQNKVKSGGAAMLAEEVENKVESVIRRLADALELSYGIGSLAIQIGERAFKREFLGGRSPTTLAAGAVYFAVCLSNVRKTKAEIATFAGTTAATITTAYKILYREREILLDGLKTDKGLESLPVV